MTTLFDINKIYREYNLIKTTVTDNYIFLQNKNIITLFYSIKSKLNEIDNHNK